MSQSRFSIVLVGVSALLRRPLVSRLRPADGERSPWVVFTARGDLPFRRLPLGGLTFGLPFPLFGTHRFGVAARRVGLRVHDFRFSARTASELPSAGWPSGSRLPLFGTRRFGVALGELAFGLTASAFRHAPLRRLPSAGWFFCLPFRRLPLSGVAFGLTASAFRHAPLRGCPRRVGSSAFRFGVAARWVGASARRVGLRTHGFRFSACADPHRRAAEARTDGAHRHDTCFTSKHLSQHVNLPHRSPQALQNRQTPLLSPTRHPRGRRPHAHHRAHREEVHPGFGRREGRGRRTRGRDHRQSPTGTQRATRRPGLLPSHPPLLGGRRLGRTGGRGADQARARGVPPLVAHSPRPLREGSRRELRAARQKEARHQCATGRFAHGWRYAGSTRAFDGLLVRGFGCDASGHARACASLDGNARGYTCACRAFAHDVDHHGHTRTFDRLLGRGLGCDASGHACACASLDGHAFGYTCACRTFDGFLVRGFGCDASGHACACASLDGNARGYACACRTFAHDVDHHGHARAFDGHTGRRGSLTLAHGATPCRRPLRRTAFRLAPHPAERDSAGALLL